MTLWSCNVITTYTIGDGNGDDDDNTLTLMLTPTLTINHKHHPYTYSSLTHSYTHLFIVVVNVVVSWFRDPEYPDGDPLLVRVDTRPHESMGRCVLFLDEICPVRVCYEIDSDNQCLYMMRKGLDVTGF